MAEFAILHDLLRSSSSSSSSETDETDNELYEILGNKENKTKIKNYIEVIDSYSDEEFKIHFRVKRHTSEILINRYRDSEMYQATLSHGGTTPISPEISILSFLWFAGNKCCIRDVADRFGIALSTAHLICTRVMDFLHMLGPQVIKFPQSDEEKRKTAADFFKICGFPGVIGCIDGTYVSIRTPAHKIKSTYVNRHDMPSITLQAICDANKLFTDVFTGTPSKIHDARVYSLSFISKKIPHICGEQFHLLGDSAYPVRTFLITPFRDYGTLTEEQKKFNKKFSATRVKIENTFGLLKQRWRQLINLEFFDVSRITHFIIACCILHNLCIMNEDIWNVNATTSDDDGDHSDFFCDTDQAAKLLGEEKRNMLCQVINDVEIHNLL